MKILYKKVLFMLLIASPLFFSGCEGIVDEKIDESFIQKSAKELLDKNALYFVDTSGPQYSKYLFKENYLIEHNFETKKMEKVVSTKRYEIYYINDYDMTIVENNRTRECSFITCEEDNYVVISCDEKDIFLRGWRELEDAIIDDSETIIEQARVLLRVSDENNTSNSLQTEENSSKSML